MSSGSLSWAGLPGWAGEFCGRRGAGCLPRALGPPVDVCAELRLDVTQPELRGSSMTALHRRWPQDGDVAAREKITVLNLRHSLSTPTRAS